MSTPTTTGARPITRRGRRTQRRGLGLVELLISLMISASLLTAVGTAYVAMSDAIEMNDQFARASQAARVTINQVTAEVRKCNGGVVEDDSLELTPPAGEKKLYEFDAPGRRVTLRFPDSGDPRAFTLVRNVDAAQFYTDGETISMIVSIRIGNNKVTMSGAGTPRRTMSVE